MKITAFTSNQRRHVSLIQKLAGISDELYVIQECTTVFPGQVDDFYQKSKIMQAYFSNVIRAENQLFEDVRFSDANVRILAVRLGDLSRVERSTLDPALQSDLYVVFGASYIKGWLIDFLVTQRAINIHMGLSPYYRGSACNFWALMDGNPAYVGATVHLLSAGLDSGEMLFHCVPTVKAGDDAFQFSMRAVDVAQKALCARIKTGEILEMRSIEQDRSLEIRYSGLAEFTDEVAQEYLQKDIDLGSSKNDAPELLRPFYG